MRKSGKTLPLISGLLVALALVACTAQPVSVAPSATPTAEPATEKAAPAASPSPEGTSAAAATTAATATEPPAPTPTPIPPNTATPASAATSLPEPAPAERQVPKDKSEVARITATDLKARLDSGEAILVVDSRSLSDFERRHIAGAISVPAREVAARLDEFPRDQEIVFYCT